MIAKAKVNIQAVKQFEQVVAECRDYSPQFNKGIVCIDKLFYALEDYENKITDGIQHLQNAQSKLEFKIKNIKEIIARLIAQLNELESNLEALESELNYTDSEIATTNEDGEVICSPNPTNLALKAQISAVEDEIASVRAEANSYQCRLEKANAIRGEVSRLIDEFNSVLYSLSEKKNECKELQAELENAKCSNIQKGQCAVDNLKKIQQIIASYMKIKMAYNSNEHCFLPKNAPIILSYYTLKIGIGKSNAEFIGQNYENVVNDLKDSGFSDVRPEEIKTGWAEGNTIVGVTVNNKDNYSSSDSFSPDVKIVVKYSSNDRINITKSIEGWSTKTYDTVQSALKAVGMTNIAVKAKNTTTQSLNSKVASITVNKTVYVAGDCFVQKDAPIEIEYYKLKITVGQKASDMTANTTGNYSSVVANLKNKGFVNITVYRNNSLVNGWIKKEGSVESISINGQTDFSDTDIFDCDVPIIIVVNTFKNKGCEDITTVWNN